MNKIWTIAKQEILSNFKRPSYLIVAFGIPLIAVLALVAYIQFIDKDKAPEPLIEPPKSKIGVVDRSGYFSDPGDSWGLVAWYEEEATAMDEMANNATSTVFIIADDYLETGEVERYSPEFGLFEAETRYFSQFLVGQLIKDSDPMMVLRILSPFVLTEHQLDSQGNIQSQYGTNSDYRFAVVYLFAMIMMLSVFLSANQLMRSVIVEKENRVIEIALSSVKPKTLLTGKMLGQAVAGLCQVTAWLLAIIVILQITEADIPFIGEIEIAPNVFAIALLYYIGGFLLFSTFGAAIGAVSRNMREGPQYSVVYTLPAVAPLLFMVEVVENPNGPLPFILSMIPMCSPIGMIQRIVISHVPWWQIASSLGILVVTILGALWLAGRIFKVNTLLSGSVPDLKRLGQLLIQG